MSPEFRDRVFLPVMLPVGLFAGLIAVAFAISRILLAVSEFGSSVLAIVLAAYVLLVASVIAARPRIAPRTLGSGLALGLIGVLAAGAIAGAAGPRPLEHEGEASGESLPEGGGEASAGGGGVPEGGLEFVAVDIAWEAAPPTAPPGPAQIVLVNEGATLHNIVFEGEQPDPLVEANGGETAVGELDLEPGTYTYYCDVPGHREAGMEGELAVE